MGWALTGHLKQGVIGQTALPWSRIIGGVEGKLHRDLAEIRLLRVGLGSLFEHDHSTAVAQQEEIGVSAVGDRMRL